MRSVWCMALWLSVVTFGCSESHDEVRRVTSPDGRIDAIVFETNCGAPCEFGYEVRLGPKDCPEGEEVAYLYGASRSEYSSGVNLKWANANALSIEYLSATRAKLEKHSIKIAGEKVQISLQDGVNDLEAPGGGMFHPYARPKPR